VIVEPIRVFDPSFDYPYPYAYAPDYMAENFGYVKIKTDRKDDQSTWKADLPTRWRRPRNSRFDPVTMTLSCAIPTAVHCSTSAWQYWLARLRSFTLAKQDTDKRVIGNGC
jgi:hypothetical protein